MPYRLYGIPKTKKSKNHPRTIPKDINLTQNNKERQEKTVIVEMTKNYYCREEHNIRGISPVNHTAFIIKPEIKFKIPFHQTRFSLLQIPGQLS